MTELNVDRDMPRNKIRDELFKRLAHYHNAINLMAADAPLAVLCLPSSVEKILCANGLDRVYDLLSCDFTKVEGLSESRIRDLTTRLDQFISML